MSSEWQLLVSLNEHLRPLKCPARMQEVALRLLGEHLQANRVEFSIINDDDFLIVHKHPTLRHTEPPREPTFQGRARERLLA